MKTRTRLSTVLFVFAAAAASAFPSITGAQALSNQQARAVIAPFYKALSAGNDPIALMKQAASPDWTSCSGNDSCRPRDQVSVAIAGLHKSVPDLKWEIKEVLVSGDRVIVRGEATGTPAGPFMGVSGSGKSFRIMSIDVHTIKDGKMIRSYHVEDWLRAVRQLSGQ